MRSLLMSQAICDQRRLKLAPVRQRSDHRPAVVEVKEATCPATSSRRGPRGFLQKPFEIDHLSAAVAKALRE